MSVKILNKKILITGGLGFIGSNLARRLVEHGNTITVVDSLIPEYGGNLRNVHDIQDKITVNLSDVRDVEAINNLIKGHDYLFNLAGQTSHLDSMHDPITDLDINAKAQLSILEACRNTTRIFALSLPVPARFMGSPSTCRWMKNTPVIRWM